MDAFEARGQFLSLLRKLNAGSRSNEVTLHFLRDNADLVEDLLHCLLDEISKATFNQRVNILYFVAFVVSTPSSRLTQFKSLVAQNCETLITSTVPPHKLGLSNIGHALAVLQTFESQEIVNSNQARRIRDSLKEIKFKVEAGRGEKSPETSRDDILRRIEDDRERSKKAKEKLIAVDPENPSEFREYWHALGALTELDYEHIEEQNDIAQKSRKGLFA